MATGDVYEIARQALLLVFMLSLPILGVAFLATLLSSLLQNFGKLNEPTLSYLPRIVAVFIVIFACAPWISTHIGEFASRVWTAILVAGR